MKKITFAVLLANRGFFPAEGIASARERMESAIKKAGYDTLFMDKTLTKYGAVETVAEGEQFASFLKENDGLYDGIIVSLPNFGDENGAAAALQYCDKPILLQAFEDSLDKMGVDSRCDAFCGKLAMSDLFVQCGIKFTTFQPHVINPDRPAFLEQIHKFASICRIVAGMKHFTIGAVGARTTAFKSVRCDEVALQKHGITVETIDLSSIIDAVRRYDNEKKAGEKLRAMEAYSDFKNVSAEKAVTLAKLALVLEDIISGYRLDAIAIRCWSEFQVQLGISPCLIVCMLNQAGIQAACELDIANAATMRMLSLASGEASCCMDWNNNYAQKEDECILFHCGPVANSLLKGKGTLEVHKILANSYGAENCIGSNIGTMDRFNFTYSSMKTHNGELHFYIGQGELVDEPVPPEYFGVYGVAKVEHLQDVLQYLCTNGYRHHVCLTRGYYSDAVLEAASRYLEYHITKL